MADSLSGRHLSSPTGTSSMIFAMVSQSRACKAESLCTTEQLGRSATNAATSFFCMNMSASLEPSFHCSVPYPF